MKKKLETIINVGLLLAVTLAIGTFGLKLYHEWNMPSPPHRIQGYQVGNAMDPVPKLTFSQANRSLLLFLRSGCRFCIESVPFYQRVLALRDRRPALLQIAAVSFEPINEFEDWLNRNGLRVEAFVASPNSRYRISGTPTLVLVDNKGRVERVWSGKPTKAGEDEILSFLAR